jgi:hypothetical protein
MASEFKIWGFYNATSGDDLGISRTLFSTMFQKEWLGGYLVYGSRYVGLKFHLLNPYTLELRPVKDRVLESS